MYRLLTDHAYSHDQDREAVHEEVQAEGHRQTHISNGGFDLWQEFLDEEDMKLLQVAHLNT